MTSTSSLNLARHLIQTFAEINSTEELVIRVAGTDGMLEFCRELLDQLDRDTRSPLVQDVGTICTAKGVLPGVFFAEIRKILLALNRYHDPDQNHYAMLGLQADASVAEIKQAYRRLSKEYHPDRNGASDSGKRFMEIAGAYHALMIGLGRRKTEGTVSWRKRVGAGQSRPPRSEQWFFLLLITVLVVSLTGFSLFLAAHYNRQAALSQLPSYTAIRANGNEATASPTRTDPDSSTEAVNPAAPTPAPPVPPVEVEQAKSGSPSPVAMPALTPDSASETVADATFTLAPVPMTEGTTPFIATATVAIEPTTSEHASRQPAADQKKTPATAAAKASISHLPHPSEAVAEANTAHSRAEPPPTPTDGGKANNSAAIESVINNYQKHYNKRELLSFLSLFADGATENGQPVADLSDQYRSLFDHTQAISMQIHDINWNPVQTGFLIQGRFNANYTYNDGRSKAHHGDINFTLVSNQGELKIQALDYVFQE